MLQLVINTVKIIHKRKSVKHVMYFFIYLRTCLFFCRDSKQPKPPPGTKWKEVRHDNKVTWLVSWTENIQGSIKYIMLNPSSRIKVLSLSSSLTSF